MTIFFTIFFILLIFIVALFLYISGGNISTGGADFIAKGKEAGLNSKEIKILKKASDLLGLDRPLTLLGSVKNIDNAISSLNNLLRESDFKDIDTIDLVEDLYSYRKRIELERMERRSSITNTREIDLSQRVKITVGNLETPIIGIITATNQNSLTVELQAETSVKPGVNWTGPINVYFWKKNDAGYYFESIVGECQSNRKWNIAHSDNLIRNQKREDIRVDVEINTYVYPLENITKKNTKHEGFTGTFAQLKNISEGGAAFLINGEVNSGTPLKIEFQLDDKIVVICGVVKDSSYNKANNISLVRLRIVDPGFEMLSIIRSFLYTTNREFFSIKDNKNSKDIDNVEETNNNEEEDLDEDISEVEYLPETT